MKSHMMRVIHRMAEGERSKLLLYSNRKNAAKGWANRCCENLRSEKRHLLFSRWTFLNGLEILLEAIDVFPFLLIKCQPKPGWQWLDNVKLLSSIHPVGGCGNGHTGRYVSSYGTQTTAHAGLFPAHRHRWFIHVYMPVDCFNSTVSAAIP